MKRKPGRNKVRAGPSFEEQQHVLSSAQPQEGQVMNGQKFYTAKELSELLNINYMTVLRRIKDGSIPAVRFGPRLLRIKAEDVQQFIEQGFQ